MNTALADVAAAHRREDWPEALSALKRAEELLASGEPTPELTARVAQWRRNLETVLRLENIRLADILREELDNSLTGNAAYQREFHALGIDLDSLPADEAANRIRSHVIKDQLTAALDHWVQLLRVILAAQGKEKSKLAKDWRQRLLAVARAADPDDFRSSVRHAIEQGEIDALVELAQKPEAADLRSSTLCLVAVELFWDDRGRHRKLAMELLQRAIPTSGRFLDQLLRGQLHAVVANSS